MNVGSSGTTVLGRILCISLILFATCGLFVSMGLHILAATRLQGLTRPMEFFFWGGPTFLAWIMTGLAVWLRRGRRRPRVLVMAAAKSPVWPGWLTVTLLFYAAATILAEISRVRSGGGTDAYAALRVWSSGGMALFAGALSGLLVLRRAEQIGRPPTKDEAIHSQ